MKWRGVKEGELEEGFVCLPGTALRCIHCNKCPQPGGSTEEDCDGAVCFLRVTIRGHVESVDRGCFSGLADSIIRGSLCNNGEPTDQLDGSQLVYLCCNDTDYCNQNLTFNLPTPTPSASSYTVIPSPSPSNGECTFCFSPTLWSLHVILFSVHSPFLSFSPQMSLPCTS